ncbi:MAG: LuxR C-terminal-related transcriptional regulator, partial [Pseudomonadales bacterium]|nr:LuxR C-terminal-related transcriptional regulator [Pseudomonadales bacterium]
TLSKIAWEAVEACNLEKTRPCLVEKTIQGHFLRILVQPIRKNTFLIAIHSNKYSIINVNQLTDIYKFSRKSSEITVLLSLGYNRKEISKKLDISPLTVKTYTQNIYNSLGVNNQYQLTRVCSLGPATLDSLITEQPKKKVQPQTNVNRISLSAYRHICFEEYGDPNGFPIVLCHNALGSRLQVVEDPQILHSLNIRLVVPERPGYGLSEYYKNRKLSEWPKDLELLLNALNIRDFSAIAYGNGSAYGVACAHYFRKRLKKLALCAPVPEFQDIKSILHAQSSWSMGILILARLSPTLTEKIFRLVSKVDPQSYFKNVLYATAIECDRELINQTDFMKRNVAAYAASIENGARVWASDFFITTNSWNINIEDIEQTVHIWYGAKDIYIHHSAISDFSKRFKNREEHFFPKESHWVIYRHWEDILKSALPNDMD